MTVVPFVVLSLIVGTMFGMLLARSNGGKQESSHDAYDRGWSDGYEVGRSEGQKRVQKVKTINGKEK